MDSINGWAEDLPKDILMEIFSYLTFKDLIHSVQHVCFRWKEVVQHFIQLWKPNCGKSDIEISRTLKQVPRLQILVLNQNRVGSEVLRAITHNCHYLKKLVFHEEQQLDLSDLKNLLNECPDIEHLSISIEILRSLEKTEIIAQFINVKILTVTRKFVKRIEEPIGIFFKPIADGCPSLRHVHLMFTFPTSEELAYFIQNKGHQLLTLRVACHNYDESCNLPLISECTALDTLYIHSHGRYGTYRGFQTLRLLRNITCLTLIELGRSDINDIISVFINRGMDQLEKLYIEYYHSYVEKVANVIIENCPRLKALAFKLCWVNDCSVKMLHTLCQLQSVSIRYELGMVYGRDSITDTGMSYIANCKNLTSLDLMFCDKLTKVGLKLMVNLSQLRVLNLSFCDVKGLPLELIPTRLKHLRRLIIYECRNVDEKAIKQLHSEMPHLTISVREKDYDKDSDYLETYSDIDLVFEDDPLLERDI